MAEGEEKVAAKPHDKPRDRLAVLSEWKPFETLRREIDRLFDAFPGERPPRNLLDLEPFWRGEISFTKVPAVDVVENERAYEITAELPGLTKDSVDIKVAEDVLTIKGEKAEHREKEEKDRFVSERRYGSFQRAFRIPSGVAADSIEANFQNGVLTITLPKKPDAAAAEKKIPINQR